MLTDSPGNHRMHPGGRVARCEHRGEGVLEALVGLGEEMGQPGERFIRLDIQYVQNGTH